MPASPASARTAPTRERPGFDQIAQGLGGLMSITGEPGRGPMRVGIPIADLSAGLFCALGILVALLEREQSGKGQEVATSLLQAQIFMLDFQASRWLNAREVPAQAGNNHPTSIPTGVFKTRDGHINIATAGGADLGAPVPRHRRASADATIREYATGARAPRTATRSTPRSSSYLADRTSAEWVERINAADVPCGPIYAIDQMFSDPQVKHLRHRAGHRDGGCARRRCTWSASR